MSGPVPLIIGTAPTQNPRIHAFVGNLASRTGNSGGLIGPGQADTGPRV